MMTAEQEAVLEDRKLKRIKAADIHIPGKLTDYEIGGIPYKNVYEWIKTGAWNKAAFDKWLKALRVI